MSVQDLTGTTWVINSITCAAGYGQFNIESKLTNAENPDGLFCECFYIGYALNFQIGVFTEDNSVLLSWMPAYLNEGDLIEIIEGDDVANASLISWLETHAVQLPTPNIFTVDLSALSGWDDVSVGNHTLTIKAKATGYRDSNPSTGVSFTKAASGLSLTVSYTNSTINAIQCASDESGTDAETLTITAGQSSLTVVIPANKPYVLIENAAVGNNIQSSLDNCEWVASFNEWDIHYGAIIEITNTPATAVLTKTGFQ